MRRVLAVCLLFALGAAAVLAAADVKVQRDPKFDFSKLKTWSWDPASPGDVKVWVTADSKSEPVKRQYEPVIMQAVEAELARRGFSKASGAPSDFIVRYYVLVTVGSSSQQMGQFLPAVAQWGLPPFSASTTALEVYPMGSLVIDLASPDPANVVWRGITQSKIDLERTEAERTVRLKNAVRDLLAKLPKK